MIQQVEQSAGIGIGARMNHIAPASPTHLGRKTNSGISWVPGTSLTTLFMGTPHKTSAHFFGAPHLFKNLASSGHAKLFNAFFPLYIIG